MVDGDMVIIRHHVKPDKIILFTVSKDDEGLSSSDRRDMEDYECLRVKTNLQN